MGNSGHVVAGPTNEKSTGLGPYRQFPQTNETPHAPPTPTPAPTSQLGPSEANKNTIRIIVELSPDRCVIPKWFPDRADITPLRSQLRWNRERNPIIRNPFDRPCVRSGLRIRRVGIHIKSRLPRQLRSPSREPRATFVGCDLRHI